MTVRDELLRAADKLERFALVETEDATPAVRAVLEPVLNAVEPYRGVVELRQAAKDSYRGRILDWVG